MRAVAWTLLATAFLPFIVPASGAGPMEPVVLTGQVDEEGDLVLAWNGPLTVGSGPNSFTVKRTWLDEDGAPASDAFELPGNAQTWTDRAPPAAWVVYTVFYKIGVDPSPESNPIADGPWPHCAVLLLQPLPFPPFYDVQPNCLFPPPEFPPDP